MQHNYCFRYLVTIDNEQPIVNVYIFEKCRIEEAFLVIKPSKKLSVLFGRSCLCPMTEVWADRDVSVPDGNTLLLGSVEKEYRFFLDLIFKIFVQKINLQVSYLL